MTRQLQAGSTDRRNQEEERALLGKTEYQKGNVEAALDVFDGLDVVAITPRIKATLSTRENSKRQSQSLSNLPMSIQAASLLLEAIFLKAKSLQLLARFKVAAETCKVVLDIVESALPEGLPDSLAEGEGCGLRETITEAVELLPELWKLANCLHDSVLSYRRALLGRWNFDVEATARIQKKFAVLLLYGGGEASSLNLRSQMDSSFVPRNSTEEAILLLMVLLRKSFLERVRWDASILDHLTFALSVSGDLESLAGTLEELLPGIIDRRERYYALALCYHGMGDDVAALNLLRKLLHAGEEPKNVMGLLMASKICGKLPRFAGEGIACARKAVECCRSEGSQLESSAMFVLGVCLSEHSEFALSDSERAGGKSEAAHALEAAGRMTEMGDAAILYHLCLEHAEQRKLDAALHYAKCLLKLESGSNVRAWLLLARILSAHKRFVDAETIVDAALDQTVRWDQGELLRTKAKLQIAQGQVKSAIDTYTLLLGILQVQIKCFGAGKKLPHKGNLDPVRQLELEVWHDLAHVYINLSQWSDAETCLSKSKAVNPCSASRCHSTGVLQEQKGLYEEAHRSYQSALDADPTHVPSLVSTAMVLRRLCCWSSEVSRSLLMDALRIDRMNSLAWHNLGLLYKAESSSSSSAASSIEAAECFQAAAFLRDSEPIEPFR